MEARKKESEPHRMDLRALAGENWLAKSCSLSRTRCFEKHFELFFFSSQISSAESQFCFFLAYCGGLSALLGCLKLLIIFWSSEVCGDSRGRSVWFHIWDLISPQLVPNQLSATIGGSSGITLWELSICHPTDRLTEKRWGDWIEPLLWSLLWVLPTKHSEGAAWEHKGRTKLLSKPPFLPDPAVDTRTITSEKTGDGLWESSKDP